MTENPFPRPIRVQLSRAKGWRMPAETMKVDRSTRYGNPFRVGANMTAEDAVECFRLMLDMPGETADAFRAFIPTLRGKNLACWCAPSSPCHADVLLELANAPESETL